MKTYVINLDRRIDRMEQLSLPFEFERFSATDGSKEFPNEILKMQGHMGCWDSHRRLLRQIWDNGLPMAMVLEDDVELCHNFEDILEKCMSQLPEEWDLLYLGGWNQERPRHVTENLIRAREVYTTHGYIVRDKFIPILVKTIEDRKYKIDVVFCDALKKGNCYIANPILAWQKKGFSDITRSVNSNDHLHS